MSEERAIRPDEMRAISLPGRPSRLVARGLERLSWGSYRSIDLGIRGMVNAINNNGQWVGVVRTPPDSGGAFIGRPCLWHGGHRLELEAGGFSNGDALAINAAGQVVGWLGTFAESRPFAITEATAAWWANGRRLALDTEGLSWSMAKGLNRSGVVVGEGRGSATGGELHALLWYGGRRVDLGTLGGDKSSATGVNDRGQVVGESYMNSIRLNRAFLWEDVRMIDLGTLVGQVSGAIGINNHGQVVGWAHHHNRETRPVIWDAAGPVFTGWLCPADHNSFKYGIASAVNNHGLVVGWTSYCGEGDQESERAFVWEAGQLIALPAEEGSSSFAVGVNDRGQIVGEVVTEAGDLSVRLWEPVR